VALRIGAAKVVMRASGALWIGAERMLVVADLHLEKGSAFAARGQMLPPYDSRETLARLADEAARLRPRTVILLGDSFHDDAGEDRLPSEEASALAALAAVTELVWIVGNHDAAGPRRLPGEARAMLSVLGLTFVHEPVGNPRAGEVAGHLHPCARVRGRVGSVRRRCFVTDGERIVMPAFGAFAGGLNVRDAAFAGLFARRPMVAALGERRAHAIAWERLGPD
jgi:DNA ligase-associated metallophosphoesterase